MDILTRIVNNNTKPKIDIQSKIPLSRPLKRVKLIKIRDLFNKSNNS